MGNFLTNDPAGAMLGMLAYKMIDKNMYNKDWKRAYELKQAELSANGTDRLAATDKALRDLGYDGLNGKNPYEEILNSKQGYADAQAKGNQKLMQFMNERANLIRQVAAANGWDMTGFGEGDTLDSIKNKMNGTDRIAATIGNGLIGQPAMAATPENIGKGIGLISEKPGLIEGLLGDNKTQALFDQAKQDAYNRELKIGVDELGKAQPGLISQIEQNTQEALNRRLTNGDILGELEYKMRKQGIDPRVMQEFLMSSAQEQQRARMNNLIDKMSPDAKALMQIAMLDPNMAAFATNINPTPKEKWASDTRFDQQRKAWEIQQGYRTENADHDLQNTIALNDYNTRNSMRLGEHSAGLQVDTAGRIGALQLELGKLSFEQKVQLAQQYPEFQEFILGVKPKAMPKYADALDRKFAIAEQAIGGGDVDISGKAIDELKIEIEANKNKMDQEDYDAANMRVMALLALREYKAGYIDQAREYAKSLPESMRKAYGLIFDDKPAARAPREAQEQPKEKLGDKIRRQREAGMWVNPYTGTAYNGNPWFGTKPD